MENKTDRIKICELLLNKKVDLDFLDINPCYFGDCFTFFLEQYNDDLIIVDRKGNIRTTSLNKIEDKKILILGAGGVVPSIIFALNKMNVSKIIISNRTKKKAEDLKSQFHNLEVLDWGDINDFDVIINATSLGLNKETINLDFSKFANNKLFYDVIYNPEETNFLKEGKKLGNRTENGKLMFIYQAFEAFKLWHGIEPQINSDILEILNND